MTTDLTPEVLAELRREHDYFAAWFSEPSEVARRWNKIGNAFPSLLNAAEREAAARKRVEEMRGEMLNEFAETVAHEKGCAWLGWSAIPPDTSLRRLAERIINRWDALSTSTEQEKG